MTILIAGLVIFLGVHSTRIVADGLRAQLVVSHGEQRYKGIYSLLSIIGFVVLIVGYGMARQTPVAVWSPPAEMKIIAAVLMIPAFVLLAAAYTPGTRIKKSVGHPMLLGIKTWAFAHLLANGTLHDMVLFGAFFVWAVVDFISCRRRDRAAGRVYVTGPIPRDITAVMIGLVAWIAFVLWLHKWLIGVSPMG